MGRFIYWVNTDGITIEYLVWWLFALMMYVLQRRNVANGSMMYPGMVPWESLDSE